MMPQERVRTLGILILLACIAVLSGQALKPHLRNKAPDRARSLASLQPSPVLLHPLPGYVLERGFGKQLLRAVSRACELKGDTTYRIHALRLITLARRELPGEPSEVFFEDSLNSMLDHRSFERMVSELPILRSTTFGACYRTHARPRPSGIMASMPGGMTHVDKPLSVSGELGFPLSIPLHTADGDDLIIADVLEDSLQRYHAERELEWSFVAYCDYLGGQKIWTNGRGEQHHMNELLNRLLEQDALEGPCLGGHRLYALAKGLATRHHPVPLFSEAEYASIRRELQAVSLRLAATQRQDGAWDRRWSGGPSEHDNSPRDKSWDLDAFTATSHMLEWFAIAEQGCRPPDDVIRRAVQYVEARLQDDTNFCFNQALGPTTHAVRALFHLSEPHSKLGD